MPFPLAAHNSISANSEWMDLAARPDANTTSQLIFDAINSLQQQWAHTRYRNGHSIVPGTVPIGTLLYHGRADSELPSVPEWTATDPELSFAFAGDVDTDTNGTLGGCWHLTLVATRPLKVLYFDGSSAVNMRDGGQQDTQDLILWGKVDPERWNDDRARLSALCAWGKDFGLDGFLRMEYDFEILLCDFSEGVELVSTDYLAALWTTYIKPSFQRSTALSPYSTSSLDGLGSPDPQLVDAMLRFESVHAGSWHNQYPGDTRVRLDLTGFISFYDTTLAPSLVPLRQATERWDYRAAGISAPDLIAVKTRIAEVLEHAITAPESGVDWQTLYRAIFDRYADRMETLAHLLNTTTLTNVHERARVIQMQFRIMLTPYILYTARPDPVSSRFDDAWALPVWKNCATKHTAYIHTSPSLQSRLTPSEQLLLRALDETNREICRVVVRMWVAGVHADLDAFIPLDGGINEKTAIPNEKLLAVVESWRANTQGLMAWLDWAVWVKCRPACRVEEICYLPTWPFFWGPDRKGDERWKRPQPRCIRRFEPYSEL
ncbi:hypothetical protein K438DRAFT_1620360 [Mycena galopus ATCC 62051]|nr:hypothetical protein K438DRAFT_1620360 [Mycena galopus ATCC 62051]